MMTSFPVGLHLRSQMHFSLDFTGGGGVVNAAPSLSCFIQGTDVRHDQAMGKSWYMPQSLNCRKVHI